MADLSPVWSSASCQVAPVPSVRIRYAELAEQSNTIAFRPETHADVTTGLLVHAPHQSARPVARTTVRRPRPVARRLDRLHTDPGRERAEHRPKYSPSASR